MGTKDKHTLQVNAIRNGTVIDHIPSSCLFKVISLLKLERFENQMVFAMNLESQKVKSKALIKISDVFFDDADVNKIALIAPQVKLSVIKEYEIVEKKKVRVPDTITGLARCFNPQCITNHEAVTTRFSVIKQNEGISLKCHYCEKITIQEHIQLN